MPSSFPLFPFPAGELLIFQGPRQAMREFLRTDAPRPPSAPSTMADTRKSTSTAGPGKATRPRKPCGPPAAAAAAAAAARRSRLAAFARRARERARARVGQAREGGRGGGYVRSVTM